MTTVRPDARAPHRLRSTLPGVAAVVITTLLLALPSALAGPASSAPPPFEPAFWDNGTVLCAFDASAPGATIGANGTAVSGMSIALSSISSTDLAGLITETAVLSGATWTVVNLSSGDSYALEYTSTVPVETLLDLPLGSATVTVGFAMSDDAGASAATVDTVAMNLSVVGWPLDLLSSNLTAEFNVLAANLTGEHLVTSTTGGDSVTSFSNATGNATAYLNLSPTASITSSGGILSQIPIVGQLLSPTPTSATVAVSFGASATTAKSVNYTSAVQVVPTEHPVQQHLPPNPLPGHLPTTDFLAVAGAAVLISLAIAGATRRVRRSPSDLEYVEEEEP